MYKAYNNIETIDARKVTYRRIPRTIKTLLPRNNVGRNISSSNIRNSNIQIHKLWKFTLDCVCSTHPPHLKRFYRKSICYQMKKRCFLSHSFSCSIDFPFRNILFPTNCFHWKCDFDFAVATCPVPVSSTEAKRWTICEPWKTAWLRVRQDLVPCRLGIKNRSAWKLPSRETLRRCSPTNCVSLVAWWSYGFTAHPSPRASKFFQPKTTFCSST